jgi:hypothetical protein
VAEKYFKNILENILNRENFKILNASFIFDILPFAQSELIKDTARYWSCEYLWGED